MDKQRSLVSPKLASANGAGGDSGNGQDAARTGRRTATRPDKIALVLAGGGITGAVYEIGALCAIDDMLVDLSVNDFDIYVGTSAGALVGSFMANGFSPHEIMQLLDNRHPELRGVNVGDVLHVNLEGIWRRTLSLPRTLFQIAFNTITRWHEIAVSDILWELADLLPSGIYNGTALDRYVRQILEGPNATNRFDQLKKDLYIVATALDTGGRAVFGAHAITADAIKDVPISMAVAASSAVPLIYRPVQIGDSDYVDGGLHGAASLDLAIEAGAKLVVCVNPMVPLDASEVPLNEHYIRKHGLQAIINQTVRTLLHSSVRYHIKNLRTKYPDVDIILIQPHPDDHAMFSYNPMYYRSRLAVAEHGFESVTRGMLDNFDYFGNVLARHNIRISKTLVAAELDKLKSSQADPQVVQQIIVGDENEELCRPDRQATKPVELNSALSELETTLHRLRVVVGG